MTSSPKLNRMQKQLVNLITLESAIEERLESLMPEVSTYPKAASLLAGFLDLPRDQQHALETRLLFLSDNTPQMSDSSAFSAIGGFGEEEDYPVSKALQIAHTIFNQAVISYSMLVPMGTRFLDSPYFADEGTSFHLAKQHMGNYTQAIQKITHLLHDVLLWELDQEGFECRCQCPACGVGICLCSMAGRLYLSGAWESAGPILKDGSIYVQLPREDSEAVKAGLQKGDVILSVNGQVIESFGNIQSAIRNAEPGEEVKLTVRKISGKSEEEVSLRL